MAEDFEYFDKIVTQELYFENQEIDEDESGFNELLFWILTALQVGKSIKQIKQYIKRKPVSPDTDKKLKKLIEQQYGNITGKEKKFNLGQQSTGGYTFSEQVAEWRASIRKRAIRFMNEANEALKAGTGINRIKEIIKTELKKYKKATEQFFRNQAKAGREYAYLREDEKIKEEIRGWMSVAILDNRTSAICASLHNRFYDVRQYKSRADVPNPPPRHPNCRSILLTVTKGKDIRNFRGETLNTFLKRNPKVGRDMMGIRKYKLFSEGKAKIDKYLDVKGGRWYTNKEIVKRLGIKSEKRLAK